MYYSQDHAALLPDGTAPLPMPETKLEHLWVLAALSRRHRLGPVPCGPLVAGRRRDDSPETPAAASAPTGA